MVCFVRAHILTTSYSYQHIFMATSLSKFNITTFIVYILYIIHYSLIKKKKDLNFKIETESKTLSMGVLDRRSSTNW